NFMLRVAATTSLDIAGVVAVSPVIDPAESMMALERGFPVYRRYFARKWLRSLLRKQALWPHDYDFSELAHLTDLRRMTAVLVRRYTDFASLEDYLNGYSITGQRLASLSSPA